MTTYKHFKYHAFRNRFTICLIQELRHFEMSKNCVQIIEPYMRLISIPLNMILYTLAKNGDMPYRPSQVY